MEALTGQQSGEAKRRLEYWWNKNAEELNITGVVTGVSTVPYSDIDFNEER